MNDDCYACRHSADPDAPPRERVVRTAYWRAAHDFSTALPGWLVLLPVRHVTSLDELTPEESAELGPLLSGLTAALKDVTGCVKTYVLLLAEKDGFAHLHFHVVPRAADLPEELTGPRILTLLGSDHPVPPAEQDDLARRIGAAMPAG